jgi:hypothetical protein
LWPSAFRDPTPGSPWRLTVNFSYGGPGWQLDPGDGTGLIDFTEPSLEHTYAMPTGPRGAALITARLLAPGGAEVDTLTFEIPRLDSSPPNVAAMPVVRADDWPAP